MEYNTIIWTYTSAEKTEFETQKKYIGVPLPSGTDVPKLIILQQSCIEYRASKGKLKIMLREDSDKICQEYSFLSRLEFGEGTILFHHGWHQIPGNEHIPSTVTILDYSSNDKHYSYDLNEARQGRENQFFF